MITTDDKRAFLQNIAWDAEDKDASIFSLIKSSLRGQVKRTSSGANIIGTSGNGRSTSLAVPDFFKNTTPEDLRRMLYQLLVTWQEACTSLGITPEEDDASQDAAIFAQMNQSDSMIDCTSFQNDFTMFGWPQVRTP